MLRVTDLSSQTLNLSLRMPFLTMVGPLFSKKTPYHCHISSCILMAQVPQLTEATKYLIGLAKIINGTQVVLIGHGWAILPRLIQGGSIDTRL